MPRRRVAGFVEKWRGVLHGLRVLYAYAYMYISTLELVTTLRDRSSQLHVVQTSTIE